MSREMIYPGFEPAAIDKRDSLPYPITTARRSTLPAFLMFRLPWQPAAPKDQGAAPVLPEEKVSGLFETVTVRTEEYPQREKVKN